MTAKETINEKPSIRISSLVNNQNHALKGGEDLMQMTSQIVTAYLKQNQVDSHEVPEMIENIYNSLSSLAAERQSSSRSAVPIKQSITPDYIICLEDGKKMKMLKRHLRTNFGLTPEEYRAKWGLSPDYPMVAPNYAAKRSAFAKKIGLGKSA